jgi:hypothetical protein
MQTAEIILRHHPDVVLVKDQALRERVSMHSNSLKVILKLTAMWVLLIVYGKVTRYQGTSKFK